MTCDGDQFASGIRPAYQPDNDGFYADAVVALKTFNIIAPVSVVARIAQHAAVCGDASSCNLCKAFITKLIWGKGFPAAAFAAIVAGCPQSATCGSVHFWLDAGCHASGWVWKGMHIA